MPLRSGILPRSLRPSTQAIMSRKRTRSFGSTLPHCTRTPTRVSKVEARTGASPPCRLLLHTPLPMPPCQWLPCLEATPALSTSTAATAAVAVHRCLLTPFPYNGQTAHTISVHQCTTDTTSPKAMATTTWSSLSERCTEHGIRYMSNTI